MHPTSKLSKKEKEVFDLLKLGLSQKEIAQHQQVTLQTIKIQVSSLLYKYQVKSTLELVTRWYRHILQKKEKQIKSLKDNLKSEDIEPTIY